MQLKSQIARQGQSRGQMLSWAKPNWVEKLSLAISSKAKMIGIPSKSQKEGLTTGSANFGHIGCVVVPWHFEFYILKCKKFKMQKLAQLAVRDKTRKKTRKETIFEISAGRSNVSYL